MNILGAALVALVLALNLTRLDSVIALSASGLVALYLWRAWVRHGRPGGPDRGRRLTPHAVVCGRVAPAD